MIEFVIPGEPSHAARMRATARGGFARVYAPKQNVISTKIIQDYAIAAMRQVGRGELPQVCPFEGPISLEVVAYYLYPSSWSQPKRSRSGGWKTSRPDCDNIIKLVKDSMNSIVWRDDAQVVSERIEKRYADIARTEIRVELVRLAA